MKNEANMREQLVGDIRLFKVVVGCAERRPTFHIHLKEYGV
jgi:hypothetical protein